ncbi:hypothetical protein PSI17_15305 [Xenorhabdus sp. IM139775]|nr:hypothetical protein [Xenorhabdus sp. IM139775]
MNRYFENHSIKTNDTIRFLWISFLLCISMIFTTSALGKSKMDYKYLLSMDTSKSFCYLSVNGMPAMDNPGAGTHGVQSSGLNATAFLENGINTIELLFKDRTSEKSNKFDPNARCETT